MWIEDRFAGSGSGPPAAYAARKATIFIGISSLKLDSDRLESTIFRTIPRTLLIMERPPRRVACLRR
jgi:hypothetical protein